VLQARAAQAAEDAKHQEARWKARGEELRQSRVHMTPEGKLRIEGVQLEGLSEEGSSEEEAGVEGAAIAGMKTLQVRVKPSRAQKRETRAQNLHLMLLLVQGRW